MLTSRTLENTNVVVAEYSGSLSTEEMVAIRDELERVVAAHGSARLLAAYGDIDFGRIEPKAYWEDLKTAGLIKSLDRVAIVADQKWVQTVTGLAAPLLPTTVKVFATTERAEAMAWVLAER